MSESFVLVHMHIESEKATDLAGEMERGATLSHLCY